MSCFSVGVVTPLTRSRVGGSFNGVHVSFLSSPLSIPFPLPSVLGGRGNKVGPDYDKSLDEILIRDETTEICRIKL